MNPARVRERDRLADALEDPQPLGQVGHMAQVVAQRLASDALHHVKEPAVGEPPGVVDRDDARVFEPGEDARLAAEPAFEARAGERVRNLDRHLALELIVDGEEDRSHAAATDFFDDRVAAGLELRPAAERAQARDGRVRQPVRGVAHSAAHSTSRPKRSRASRRNSWSLPHSPRSASRARSRKRRRTCARLLVTCACVSPNSRASSA